MNQYVSFASKQPIAASIMAASSNANTGVAERAPRPDGNRASPGLVEAVGDRSRDRLRAYQSAHGLSPNEVGMRLPRSGVRLLLDLVLEQVRFGWVEVGQHGGGRAGDGSAVSLEPAATATPETVSECWIRLGLVAADGVLGAPHRVILRHAEIGVHAGGGGRVARHGGLHDEVARDRLPLGTREPLGERQSRRAARA